MLLAPHSVSIQSLHPHLPTNIVPIWYKMCNYTFPSAVAFRSLTCEWLCAEYMMCGRLALICIAQYDIFLVTVVSSFFWDDLNAPLLRIIAAHFTLVRIYDKTWNLVKRLTESSITPEKKALKKKKKKRPMECIDKSAPSLYEWFLYLFFFSNIIKILAPCAHITISV